MRSGIDGSSCAAHGISVSPSAAEKIMQQGVNLRTNVKYWRIMML